MQVSIPKAWHGADVRRNIQVSIPVKAARIEATKAYIHNVEETKTSARRLNDLCNCVWCSVMQAKSRLPFLNYQELVDDCIQQGARIKNKKGMTPEMYEYYFKTANEAFAKATGAPDNAFSQKQAYQSG